MGPSAIIAKCNRLLNIIRGTYCEDSSIDALPVMDGIWFRDMDTDQTRTEQLAAAQTKMEIGMLNIT